MKKILLLIISIIFLSCKSESQVQINYANLLNDCLTQNDIKILNKGCGLFEKELLKNYNNEKVGLSYKKFLNDFQTMQLPKEMFQNKETTEFLSDLKKSDLFNKIWEKYEENVYEEIEIVTANENENIEPEKDFYQINGDGEYLSCLMTNCENPNLMEFLESIKEIPDISPGILAGALTNELNEKEFDKGIMRLIIAIDFFYELKLNLSE